MHVHIRKWGNSASVRLPAAIMAAASVRVDQAVDIREEHGLIVIEPIRPRGALEELLAQMDPSTFPDDIDFGPRTGGEVW
ncbi:MAG TPA: AbrB/MazE/SpoVT family DNA-binding domain-containing protein [Caulobacteraceae bacterium]